MPQSVTDSRVIEVDRRDGHLAWAPALRDVSLTGRRLLAAFNSQGEASVGKGLWWALKRAADALNALHGGHFRMEIADIAAALDVPEGDVVTANVAYDLSQVGCSTVAIPRGVGPLHARNLDWSFPRRLLQKCLVVVRVRRGAHGGYTIVTWPGCFGVLTGVAKGRFSITINYVSNSEESRALSIIKRAALGYWPVTWAVRRAFDEAADFERAVRMLKETLLVAPVLFMVVGTRNDERVVIERGCDTWAERRARGDQPLCLTNHYVTRQFEDENDRLEEMDTVDRFAALERAAQGQSVTDGSESFRMLSKRGILRDDTQYQVALEPRSGRLTVRIPRGRSLVA